MTELVSLVATVYNEDQTINEWLDSIQQQTRLPDEVVIVDGGSSDNTFSVLEKKAREWPLLKVHQLSGANIPKGRNEAIRLAENDIIAATDAGCTLEPDWLEKITDPFEDENVKAVAGAYRWHTTTAFARAVGTYMGTPCKALHEGETFLPSARSVAFRKEVWEKVGGYPEWLDAAEDTFFDLAVLEAGYRFRPAPDAVVHWRVPSRAGELWRMVVRNSRGDGTARLGRRMYNRLITRWGLLALLGLTLVAALAMGRWQLVAVVSAAVGVSALAELYLKVKRRVNSLGFLPVMMLPTVYVVWQLGSVLGYMRGLTRIREKRSCTS